MLRSAVRSIVLVVAAALVASCTDNAPTGTLPKNAARPGGARTNVAPGTCTTLSNLTSLVNTVFGAGSPDANSVLGKLANLQKQLDKGDYAGAQDQAKNIVAFIQQKAAQGGLPGTSAQIQTLIAGVLCYAGISPDTFLVYPDGCAAGAGELHRQGGRFAPGQHGERADADHDHVAAAGFVAVEHEARRVPGLRAADPVVGIDQARGRRGLPGVGHSV